MKNHVFFIVLTLCVFAWLSEASASERRTLGGYRFIPTPEVRDPFVTTHFRNATGVSIASGVDIPVLVLPTEPPDTLLTIDGNYIFILTEMEYQYAFNDRFALGGTVFGASRVGTTGESIVSQGVSATWGGELGATVRLWQNDRLMLSALADLRFGKVLVVDMIGFVEDIVVGSSTTPSLVKAEDRTTFIGGLAGAWAINEWAGVTAHGDVGQGQGSVSGTQTNWSTAVAASVDFGQRDQAPVGLLASVSFAGAPNAQGFVKDTISSFGLGAYYTGREDFNVGGEVKWSKVPLEFGELDANPVTIEGVLRYFF